MVLPALLSPTSKSFSLSSTQINKNFQTSSPYPTGNNDENLLFVVPISIEILPARHHTTRYGNPK
jgi:hypothetical protein